MSKNNRGEQKLKFTELTVIITQAKFNALNFERYYKSNFISTHTLKLTSKIAEKNDFKI